MGSLGPAFAPARPVSLTVKPPCADARQRPVSIRPEETIGRLRYCLGGDRPSQTARLTLSSHPLQGAKLEDQYLKGGIPTSTPPRLAPRSHSLPPMLYMVYPSSISSYSQAPWGLSVLPRVTCIFTGTTISPGLSLRQFPSRYAIRAGQNLPDKEFRYLRTVIVTAAVYWGLSSHLRLR